MEALTHGKPMILVPLFADQYRNARIMHSKNIGIILDKKNLTARKIKLAIQTILDNKMYDLYPLVLFSFFLFEIII